MQKFIFIAIAAIFVSSLASCSLPTAKCHLIYQNADVIVADAYLANYEEGDTLFLELREIGANSWKVADRNIFFKDTTYVFESQAGPYNIHIAKAVIKKKF